MPFQKEKVVASSRVERRDDESLRGSFAEERESPASRRVEVLRLAKVEVGYIRRLKRESIM